MNPGCYNQPHVANKGIILFRGRHYDTGEGEGERYTEVTHPSCSICKPAGNQHDWLNALWLQIKNGRGVLCLKQHGFGDSSYGSSAAINARGVCFQYQYAQSSSLLKRCLAMAGLNEYSQWLEMLFSSSADINECLDSNGNCEDVCINTEGSFMCQCLNGRVLATDNRTCEGILTLFWVSLYAYMIALNRLYSWNHPACEWYQWVIRQSWSMHQWSIWLWDGVWWPLG